MFYVCSTSPNPGGNRGVNLCPWLGKFISKSRNQPQKRTCIEINIKELCKIKIVFSYVVKLCSEKCGLTKESFLKIIDFDPDLEESNGHRCLEEE